MPKPPIIVSACLAGLSTRYDGEATPCEPVLELIRLGLAIPVCPEQLGGRPTPRDPNEILDGRVVDASGNDFTEAFQRGAAQGLALARLAGCTTAVLKAHSPSCGKAYIYDGTFSGTLTPGHGIFAQALLDAGISVLDEQDPLLEQLTINCTRE